MLNFLWNFIDRFYSQLVKLISNILIARILLPQDYGFIAVVSIFSVIGVSLSESGFLNALIQKKDRTDSDFSTVFLFNVIVSVSLYCLFWFLAPAVAAYQESHALIAVMRIATLVLVIDALSVVPRAKLIIQKNFRALAFITAISVTISSMTALFLARSGYGVWTLVYQSLIGSTLNVSLILLYVRWLPTFKFEIENFIGLWSYGYKLLLSLLLNRLVSRSFYMFIGKFWGTTQLGYYSKAEQLAGLPVSNLTGLLQTVSFPDLCKLQDNRSLLKNKFAAIIRLSSMLLLPVISFLVMNSEEIVIFLLGDSWSSLVDPFRFFCLAGVIYGFNFYSSNLFLATGDTSEHLKLEFIRNILVILSFLITIKLNLMAVIIGQLFVGIIYSIILLFWIRKIIEYTYRDFLVDFVFKLAHCVVYSLIFYVTSQFLGVHNLIVTSVSWLLWCVIVYRVFFLSELRVLWKEFNIS